MSEINLETIGAALRAFPQPKQLTTGLPAFLSATEQYNYAYSRDSISFETLKRELGHTVAVAFEITYQGADQLQAQSREALAQMNHILEALGRPVLLRWPMEGRSSCDLCNRQVPASQITAQNTFHEFGEFEISGPSVCRECRGVTEADEPSDWTPVDEALGRPIFEGADFWFCRFKRSSDAVQLASDYPCCDVVDLETETAMTANEAGRRLDDDRYSEFEKFGVSFPETLNAFVTDFCSGLYPGLETK